MRHVGAEQNIAWNAEIASALEWWRDAGVDVEIADAPRDWLARAPAPASAAAPEAAQLPATWEAFATWRTSEATPDFGWSATPLGAEGPADAELMVLIEMPERDDAAEGRLLGGACGRLFDRMLAAIGQTRGAIHLAALTVARPVSGRIPAEAVEPLAAIARHHVALVGPKRLLLLGNAPARALLATDCAPARGSLRALNHPGGKMPDTVAVASFHPRLLLETPAAKAEAWKDLQLLIGKSA